MRAIVLAVVSVTVLGFGRAGAQTYEPTRSLKDGDELVVVFISSSTCIANHQPSFLESVPRMMASVAERARAEGLNPSIVGVSLDWNPQVGFDYLRQFGSFDEITSGRNWANSAAVDHIWRDEEGRPVVPQVVLLRRQIDLSNPRWIHFSDDEVIGRFLGGDEIVDWTSSGTPIPGTRTGG